MTSDLYVCRCGCGAAFLSAYTTTRLCPGCSLGLAAPDLAPEPGEEDDWFALAGFLCCHPFQGSRASELLAYKAGRCRWAFVLLAAALVIGVLGYLGAMGQADAQGWGQ